MTRQIGIGACSTDGAPVVGPHDHPEVPMHTLHAEMDLPHHPAAWLSL